MGNRLQQSSSRMPADMNRMFVARTPATEGLTHGNTSQHVTATMDHGVALDKKCTCGFVCTVMVNVPLRILPHCTSHTLLHKRKSGDVKELHGLLTVAMTSAAEPPEGAEEDGMTPRVWGTTVGTHVGASFLKRSHRKIQRLPTHDRIQRSQLSGRIGHKFATHRGRVGKYENFPGRRLRRPWADGFRPKALKLCANHRRTHNAH